MLSKYYEQLNQLYHLLRNGRDMDFGLWKETMVLTFSIIMQTLGFIIALVLMFVIPVIVKTKLKTYFNKKIREVKDATEGNKVLRQRFIANNIYWICLIAFYIPFVIPTLLLLL